MLLAARIAVCDEPGQPQTQNAKALYDAGVTEYNLGHYDNALRAFEQGYRVRHEPEFLFNIGQCQRQLHRYEDAQHSYRAYLREAADLPQTTREQVQGLVAEMEKAGAYTRAQAASIVPTDRAAAQPAAPALSVSPVDERSGHRKFVAGLAVAAFGVAAIAAGGGFYAVASSANDQVNHPSNDVYSASAENGRDTFQALDIAAFIVGGVAIVAGGTIALLGWRQRHRLTTEATASGHAETAAIRF